MAPKHKKEKRAEEDVFTLEAEGTVEAKKEEELNLSDSTALKRALDEAVVEVSAAQAAIARHFAACPCSRPPLLLAGCDRSRAPS